MDNASSALAKRDDGLARKVMQVRCWQHRINETLKADDFRVPVHLAFGYEALVVAIDAVLGPDDRLALSHRNVAYNLARSNSVEPVTAEYDLKESGLASGKLGSMNLANPSQGIAYVSSILGNNMPVSCGLAVAKKLRKESGMVTVVTGDGAMEEGAFYESFVLSKSLELPILFLIENNEFAMASTIDQRRCPIEVSKICAAVDIPYWALDGNDVWRYRDVLDEVRREVLDSSRPACIEVHLATMNRHAGATPGWPEDPMQIDVRNGLLIESDDRDPLFVLREQLPDEQYRTLEAEITSLEGQSPL